MNIKKEVFSIIKKMPESIVGSLIRGKLRLEESVIGAIQFKIADTKNELEQAFRLVNEVYKDAHIITNDENELRLKLANANPLTTVFIAKRHDKVIMTMSLFPDSALGLPMDSFFKDEVNKLREEGRYVAEVGAFASDPAFRKCNQTLPLLMNKIMHTYATEYLQLDDLLITVHPKHVWVYKNLLLFKQIGKCKGAHDEDIEKYPVIPFRMKLEMSQALYKKAYGQKPAQRNLFHFFWRKKSKHISLPREKSPYYVWNRDMLYYFFEKRTNVFRFAPSEVKDYIFRQHQRYSILLA